MSDRELLELAAKAAGFDLYVNLVGAYQLYRDGKYVAFWNPLAIDGDALRLAVDFRMLVDADDLSVNGIYFESGDDRRAALRRAIVRAAAGVELAKPEVLTCI